MEQGKEQDHKVEEQLEHLNLQSKLKQEYINYSEIVKTLEITQFAPPEWLKNTEMPFKWSQCIKPELLFKGNLDSKLEDYSYDNGSCYTLEKCSLLLTLVFEKVILKNNEKARIYLNQLEQEVSNISSNESNEMTIRIGPALKHIYAATNAYVISLSNDLQLEESSRKIITSLEPISEMSPQIQAGLEALKGKFYLWCYSDANYALQHMLAASKLDPDFAPWQYWTGKISRKIRREIKEQEPKEEIAYLESAVEKQRDPKHLIYLAQAYREKARFLHKASSNNYGCLESDHTKDELNIKSLQLYNKKYEVQSQSLTGAAVKQIKERIFQSEIDIVVCSEKMDLIMTANSRGDVGLHRSLDLQTVWTRSPPNREVKRIGKLAWRPDCQAVAIAYSYSEVGDSALQALVLVVSIENEELNRVNIDGNVTCLNWCESKITSSVPVNFTCYFPDPTPLSDMFCVGVDLKKRKTLLKDNSERMMNFLMIGSSFGDLIVVVGGFLSCGSLSISNLLKIENKKYWIRSNVFSNDMKFMFVLIDEESTNKFTLPGRDSQVLVLDTSVLSMLIPQINHLKTRIGKILTLVDQIIEVQSCLTEVWECLKVAEIASNFNKYGLHFDSIESMVADFCELITFGVLSSSLEQFLLESLNCNRVKKMIQSVRENCSHVETLVSSHLKPFLEELLIILSELTGMAQLDPFKVLGLANNFVLNASNNVRILLLKAGEFRMVVQSLEKNYTAFYQWLNSVIGQLNSDEIQVLNFSEGLADNNLPLIIDYLNSICHISYAYDEPISFFQHLGQYFEEMFLSKPLEPHTWQEFLEDRNDALRVACFIPVSRTLSLAQGFKTFYESISSVCSAPGNALTPLFSKTTVIDLPEMFLDSSIVDICYFSDHLSLMIAFVNHNEGELRLIEVLPHYENCNKRKTVLKLENENDYKCLDVKWYPDDKLFALFEDEYHSNLLLVQMEKSGIDQFKSDCVNINAIEDGVFVWNIPLFSVSSFAVSCKRKFGATVSKSKKKIQTFDIGFEEDESIKNN